MIELSHIDFSALFEQHRTLVIMTIILFVYLFHGALSVLLIALIKLSVIAAFVWCLYSLGIEMKLYGKGSNSLSENLESFINPIDRAQDSSVPIVIEDRVSLQPIDLKLAEANEELRIVNLQLTDEIRERLQIQKRLIDANDLLLKLTSHHSTLRDENILRTISDIRDEVMGKLDEMRASLSKLI
jgi:hypothetical protein